MRPETDNPYVSPKMHCHSCGLYITFPNPFKAWSTYRCMACGHIGDVPDDVISQFLDNIEFMGHMKRRQVEKENPDNPPPLGAK